MSTILPLPPRPQILSDFARRIQVWNKATPIPGRDSSIWRKDAYGSIILFEAYGNTESPFGWEIDHIVPKAEGGSDDINNLQPLQWENNRRKADQLALSALHALLSQRRQ